MSSSKAESIKKPFRSIKLRSKVAALKQKVKTQNVESLKVLVNTFFKVRNFVTILLMQALFEFLEQLM